MAPRPPAPRLAFPVLLAGIVVLGPVSTSRADDEPAPPSGPLVELGQTRASTRANITVSGYVEAFYQWNFNNPSNGLTNFRGFDNRHNSFTIANAVLDVTGRLGAAYARLALQIGHTPETYYLAEPRSRGSDGAATVGREVWKFIQQAAVGYTVPLGRGLLLEGGIFLSPIGPEGMPVRDQWNWSRSNLFFGLPFYHTGLRITYPFTDRFAASLHAYNGWNSVVDNNPEKSLALQLTYSIPDTLVWNFVYFTGIEIPAGATPDGSRPWRHLFDSYVAVYPLPWLSLLLHGNGGFEPTSFGVSGWAAGALYARARALAWLYFAARGDIFYEHHAENHLGRAAAIVWPADWVSSATFTVEVRPLEVLSVRLEYRHDHAQSDIYFSGDVPIRIQTGEYIPNARSQDTLTLGATAWF